MAIGANQDYFQIKGHLDLCYIFQLIKTAIKSYGSSQKGKMRRFVIYCNSRFLWFNGEIILVRIRRGLYD